MAFDIPGRQSFIIELVGKRDLPNAIALNSSLFNGTRALGPAFAGFLIAWVGMANCFFLNCSQLYRPPHLSFHYAPELCAQPWNPPPHSGRRPGAPEFYLPPAARFRLADDHYGLQLRFRPFLRAP